MEYVLHLAYRLPFKKWQARGTHKEMLHREQSRIQAELRTRLGLLIDIPLPGGSGTSNDGNSSRTFFKEAETVAEVTNIDLTLIQNLGTLLGTLSCGFAIDTEKLRSLANRTLELHVKNYSWFYLPVTIHKILIHAADIVNGIALPIGHMSEEAQEARNKDVRRYREMFTRKFSRQKTVEDLFHRLLISSDPLISSLKYKRRRSNRPQISSAVLELLKEETSFDV